MIPMRQAVALGWRRPKGSTSAISSFDNRIDLCHMDASFSLFFVNGVRRDARCIWDVAVQIGALSSKRK